MTRGPACRSYAHSRLTQVQAWGICPQVVQGPCQTHMGMLASPVGTPRKKYAPNPYLNSFTGDGVPFPQSCSCLSGQRGSGQKGKCKEFPSACNQSSQALGVVDLWPAAAMEPLETPIKDGILYQQHIKFGKVGTLAARQLPRTNGLCPRLGQLTKTWENGDESQGGGSNPTVGVGQSPILT